MGEQFDWKEMLRKAAALRSAGDEAPEEEVLILVFPWGERLYAVESRYVERIAHIPRVFKVPGARLPVAGVVNLYGRVLPVLDPRRTFRVERPKALEDAYVAFVRVDGIEAALVMDAPGSLERLIVSHLKPPDVVPPEPYTRFLKGVVLQESNDGAEELLSLIDLEALIRSVAQEG